MRLEFSRVEEWKPTSGWPYEVSNHGRIRHAETKHVRTPYYNRHGYETVTLWDRGRSKNYPVHRLVFAAFHGHTNADLNHIDGNKANNSLSNLEATTDSENQRHAYRLGLAKPQRGERNGQAKLTDQQVDEIRRRYAIGGMMQLELAAEYGISRPQMCNILNGRRR